jgi:hypothetical protein
MEFNSISPRVFVAFRGINLPFVLGLRRIYEACRNIRNGSHESVLCLLLPVTLTFNTNCCNSPTRLTFPCYVQQNSTYPD